MVKVTCWDTNCKYWHTGDIGTALKEGYCTKKKIEINEHGQCTSYIVKKKRGLNIRVGVNVYPEPNIIKRPVGAYPKE